MTSHPCRINRWLSTGEHKFETDFVENKAVGSTIGTEKVQDGPDGNATCLSEQTVENGADTFPSDSTEESIVDLDSEPELENELLVSREDDPLIPSTDQIHCTFLKGQSIWNSYVARANALPLGCVPIGTLDPYILLQKVPSLPQDLPRKRSITGEAIWHVAGPKSTKSPHASECNGEGNWDQEYVHSAKKIFLLSISKPTKFRISSGSHFRLDNQQSNGIAILISLWSYIFSVRFLELQKRRISYSSWKLLPILTKDVKAQPEDIVIYLGSPSRELTRWLCAVLAPGLGWFVKGPLPPWAAHYQEDTRFIIATDLPVTFRAQEQPPSSREATDLLIEFCTLFDLGSSTANHEESFQALQQPTAAFLAALAVPVYNNMGSHPQLPVPRMRKPRITQAKPEYIQDYVNDLPYYMALSIHPASVGSVIWSIFWEPGLDCNLVSAWFGSILEVLRPIIEAGHLEVLAKVSMARRLPPALLWLGVFILGDLKFLDKIVSYLESHEEQLGGSWARPDVDVAVWTGSKQSFLDEDGLGLYEGLDSQVPRSDLVRYRFNFRLGDPDALRFGWQPIGHVIKREIEPELWPYLETGCSRRYKHWIWWLPEKDENDMRKIPEVIMPAIQRGFSRDHVRDTQNTTSQLELVSSAIEIPDGFSCKVRLEPSRIATFHVISYGSKDAAGDRSLEAMVIPDVRTHPWMADSRGI